MKAQQTDPWQMKGHDDERGVLHQHEDGTVHRHFDEGFTIGGQTVPDDDGSNKHRHGFVNSNRDSGYPVEAGDSNSTGGEA